ncbi:mucolipin-3 isoform X2 [Hydra vulgaris]|uniref:Mucolipin-3 isoform X2 n=1 Tax=Hydra vulgaris TaxID=6087 RepID=A0ABM4BH92_HYDVU
MAESFSEGDSLLPKEKSKSYYMNTDSNEEIHETDNEEQIRSKLQWFFKNPYEKYKERGRKPWKFLLQIVKIILVTIQATLFATNEFSVVSFNKDNIETFRRVFIFNYPNGKLLYQKNSVHQQIFHSWNQIYDYEKIMVGTYEIKTDSNDTRIKFCKTLHKDSQARSISKENMDTCYDLQPKLKNQKISLDEFINANQLPKDFEWIVEMKLQFTFQVNYTMLHARNSPDCYMFNIVILFENGDLDGIMEVRLDSDIDFHHCRSSDKGLHIQEHQTKKRLMTVYDSVIVILCTVSLSLCLRSFNRHWKLCKAASRFFDEYRYEPFTVSDKMNFLSFWLLLITLSDISTVFGTTIKITLDWMEYPELYASCSMCFGLAVLFSWIGVLRYLGFLKGYNVLLITLKTAFPVIVRFISCVAFIYIGFIVCGWIVFGPYHLKFQNLVTTSECLFALVNGDDMYATFNAMDSSDPLIWYFSKVYLYFYVSLFIFVVLSLFIGIVADTYERIKDFGYAPKSRIELFMEGNEHIEEEQQQFRSLCKLHNRVDSENRNGSNIVHDDLTPCSSAEPNIIV